MVVRCPECNSLYDDAECWTICPHGPLWAGLDAYCKEHDLVNCTMPEHRLKKGVKEVPEIETTNLLGVGVRGDEVNLLFLGATTLNAYNALNMAAWIVALIDPERKEFDPLFEAILKT